MNLPKRPVNVCCFTVRAQRGNMTPDYPGFINERVPACPQKPVKADPSLEAVQPVQAHASLNLTPSSVAAGTKSTQFVHTRV